MMSEVRNRQNNPSPEIDFQEIYLPNDQDFGTGAFRFQIKKRSLTLRKTIAAIALNPPRFQIAATLNVGTKEVPVNLGQADGSDPVSQVIFLLPSDIDLSKSLEFIVTFKNWRVISMTMDEIALIQK
jgi:hypothetical protein